MIIGQLLMISCSLFLAFVLLSCQKKDMTNNGLKLSVSNLKTAVPLIEFHNQIHELKIIDSLLTNDGYFGSRAKTCFAKYIKFTTKDKKNGSVKLYIRRYRSSMEEVTLVRIQFSSNIKSKNGIFTAALRPKKDSDEFQVLYHQIGPGGDARNRPGSSSETAGGCFDCPPGNTDPGWPGPAGISDLDDLGCVGAILGGIIQCAVIPPYGCVTGAISAYLDC